MDFRTEAADLKECLLNAIVNESTYEHKLFMHNLNKQYEANIKETGYDPRGKALPEHIVEMIAGYEVNATSDQIKKPPKPPKPTGPAHHLNQT